MNVISTWSFRPWLSGYQGPWPNTESMLAIMSASMNCALRAYEKITVYTDDLSLPYLRKICPRVNYLVTLNHAFDHVPVSYWAWPKLISYGLQKEPFLHFDLDFLFAKPLERKYFDCDMLVQWWERPGNLGFYNLDKIYNRYYIPKALHTANLDKIYSPNLGCFFVSNMQFNRFYVDSVRELVDANLNLLATDPIEMCSLEQQTLGILLYNDADIKVNVLLERQTQIPITNEFIHFVGEIKDKSCLPQVEELHNQVLNTWITWPILELAKKLDHKKALNLTG